MADRIFRTCLGNDEYKFLCFHELLDNMEARAEGICIRDKVWGENGAFCLGSSFRKALNL